MSGRPAVLVFVKGLGIGGAERLISEGARLWDRDRYEYHVAFVLPWKDQLVPDLEALGVPVACLGTKRGMTPAVTWRLRRHVEHIGARLVHAHLPTAGIAARLAVRVPVVYTEHNLADGYRQPTRTLNRVTYGRNTAVTAVSQQVAASLAAFPGPPPTVIHNGVSVAVATDAPAARRAELGLSADDPLVVHVGNIRPGKGHDTLIAATIHLPEEFTVVSIGAEKLEGDLARVRQAAEEANVGHRLHFLGRRSDAIEFIAAADVYVNPSDREGLPVTVLEALALERPVVATAVGGVPSVVHDEETGVLVAPKRPADLAAALFEMVDDQPRARRLAERGRQLVEAEYGLQRMVRAFEALYSEVLDA